MESLTPPKSLVEQAYEVILDALCDGTLKPGERLTQEDVAARLNVSRQPVTHALAVLKTQGFLAPTGRRGLIVTEIDPSFFEAIYQFRSAIEPLAVGLATARMTKQIITRGRSLIAHGRSLVGAGDPRSSLQADMDFHSYLYESAGNPIIIDTMRLHWHHLRRAMGQVLSYPGMSVSVWHEHERILTAMVRGDASGAADLMRRHVLDAFRRVQNAQPSTQAKE